MSHPRTNPTARPGWYRDLAHPELGPLYIAETLAVAPGWVPIDPPTAADLTTYSRWSARDHLDAPDVVHLGIQPPRGRVTADDVTPTDPEPAMINPTDPDEHARRLRLSLCYWCARPLHTDDPFEMFCSEDHQRAWRIATQSELRSGGIPVNPNGDSASMWVSHYVNDPDLSEPPPSWLGDRRNLTTAATQDGGGERFERETAGGWGDADAARMISLFEALAALNLRTQTTVHEPARPLPATWDYEIRHTESHGRSVVPMVYWPTPSKIEPHGQPVTDLGRFAPTTAEFGIGYSLLHDEALRELDHAPLGERTTWPRERLEALQDDGHASAVLPLGEDAGPDPLPAALRPERLCPHCGQRETVYVHTAMAPEAPESDDVPIRPSAEPRPELRGMVARDVVAGVHFEITRQTLMVCGGCLLPYPGPVLVPMVRERPARGQWEVTVVGHAGYLTRTVTREALTRTPGEVIRGRLWGELYGGLIRGAHPWGCIHPGCTTVATRWYSLTASMSYMGRVVTPLDGEPLLLPLCPTHNVDLARMIYTHRDLYPRACDLGSSAMRTRLIVH